MLCHHFNECWHLGHLEAGNTIDSPLKALKITTFRKLPMQSPIIKINNNSDITKNILSTPISHCFLLTHTFCLRLFLAFLILAFAKSLFSQISLFDLSLRNNLVQ